MSTDDEIKKLLAELDPVETRSEPARQKAQTKILSKAGRKQSQSDLMEFGFVKVWTIILQFLTTLFVRSQERQKQFKKN